MIISMRIKKFLFIGLINLLVVPMVLAQSVTYDKEPDPNCPLNYFYRGYDLVRGNPATNSSDPGWKSTILSSESNKLCFTCSMSESCRADYNVYEMAAEIDYYNSLYKKVSVSEYSENFLGSVAFTASAQYQYQKEDIFGLKLVNVQAEGHCQIYEGNRHPSCFDLVFSPGFVYDVENYPTSTSDPDWYNRALQFFQINGTHMISSYVSLGARWSFESIFAQADYDAMRAAEVNINMAAEASAEFYRTKEASAEYETEEVTEMRVMFDALAQTQSAITVGTLPPEDISFGEWANSIDNPIPQEYRLSPLSELMTPNFFPNDPNINAKRAVMEQAFLLYCGSVPGCGEPKPQQIVQVHEKKYNPEDLYQRQNFVDMQCPVNYRVIGGGCKTDDSPASHESLFWFLSSLKSQSNEFSCIASMDFQGSHANYYRGLEGSAMCLHENWIEDIVTIPCDGPTGAAASECNAFCPPEYIVTGGGCESNSPNESAPWKVTRSSPIYSSLNETSGWSCRVTQEGYTETANRSAIGYAVCVRYPEGEILDQKLVSDLSGPYGAYTNEVTVECDPGYQVLTGGCVNISFPSDPQSEWKIVESLPVQPPEYLFGWSCTGQMDREGDGYDQDNLEVQADALCVKFK